MDPFLEIMFQNWPVLAPDEIWLEGWDYYLDLPYKDRTVVVEWYEIGGYSVNPEQVLDSDKQISILDTYQLDPQGQLILTSAYAFL